MGSALANCRESQHYSGMFRLALIRALASSRLPNYEGKFIKMKKQYDYGFYKKISLYIAFS